MNSAIVIVLVLLAVISVIYLLSIRGSYSLRSRNIDDPMFQLSSEDVAVITKLQKNGKVKEAVLRAKELAKREPNNLYNRYILGMSYYKGGQTREAIFQFEAVLRHQPDHLDTREILADCYIDAKFFQRAGMEYDYILKYNKDDLNILKKAAMVYKKIKKNKEAIDVFLKITMINPDDTEALSSLAELYIGEENYEKAIETLNYAMEQDPNSLQFLSQLANLYKSTNKTNQAIEVYEKLEDSLGKDSEKWLEINENLAALHAKKESYEDAVGYYNKIVERNPEKWSDYGCKIAEIHFKEGRLEEALDILSKMIKADPNSVEAVELISKVYKHSGDYDKAIRTCLIALEKASGLKTVNHYKNLVSDLYCDLGSSALDSDKKDTALHNFAESLKYNSHNPEVYYNIAIINHKNKDYTGAVSYLKKATSLDPSNSEYFLSMAYVYDDLGDFDSAVHSFSGAIRANPANIEIKIAKGVFLANNRRYPEAIELFSRIVDVVKDNADVYYNLALAYELAGNVKLAYTNYIRSLDVDPEHIEAKGNLKVLKENHNL